MKTKLTSTVLLALLAGCSGPAPVDKPPRAVLVRTIGTAASESQLRVYTGEVRARHEADIGFRIGGKLIERSGDVGARVLPGMVLARLDPQDVQLAEQAAAAQVSAAEADVALARAEFERVQNLHARNFISASVLDSRRTALQAAEARLRQARAQRATARNQADYAALAVAYAGVVTAVLAEPGQVVAAGQPVLRVARPEQREVLIHVPESRIAALRPGHAAAVRAWANPAHAYTAAVREIAPSADSATRSYAVRVSVADADDALPLGATASVAFADPLDAAQTILPLTAVTRVDGRATVWLVDEASHLMPLAVDTGAFSEDGVVVVGGLPAGSRVVLTGVHRLVAGEAVRAVDEAAPVALDARK
ncbi:efflux RND transporter periplasmic adaptor subunit [Aromatoleum petrolei]|uniref:Efflux RND transporter periplasmic adaptor subunit n=1 Tax=Aromatoleum petrolei TaxID=76116 RepID=A0ABX1MRK8_9RHOO|nr:efflux RND transporter periplasmic adaptor subunit [Aromatoleum petrolei]NMF90622.1 efflux RND transporter periplasmic adaptor subunit [Aromatoleum petrolei]QTQ35916.1 RND efflux system, membrane fusion protein [Aromatoleum petrolei]